MSLIAQTANFSYYLCTAGRAASAIQSALPVRYILVMKSLKVTPSPLLSALLSTAVIMISFTLRRSYAFRTTAGHTLGLCRVLPSPGRGFAQQRPPASIALFSTSAPDLDVLNHQIKAKGDAVRELKAAKADDKAIKAAVDELLQLKKQLAEASGAPAEAPAKAKKGSGEGKQDQEKDDNGRGGDQRAESIVITPRATDYSAWYSDVIAAADLVDQSPVRCRHHTSPNPNLPVLLRLHVPPPHLHPTSTSLPPSLGAAW